MKTILTAIILALCFMPVRAANEIEVKIPENCIDVLIPDTASYVAFLVKVKNLIDVRKRVKVGSLKDGRALWSKKYDYDRIIKICNHGVLVQGAFDVKLCDFNTGEEIRRLDYTPIFFDQSDNFIVGAKGAKFKKLGYYDTRTGEKLWESKIDRKNNNLCFDWRVIARPDSNSVICQSEYISRLDTKARTINTYPLNIAIQPNYKPFIGVGPSMFFSPFMVSSGVSITFGITKTYSNRVTDMSAVMSGACSPAVVSDSCIFVSDREKLVCLDLELNERWTAPLPKRSGSYARLSLDGDTLRMFNFGHLVDKDVIDKLGKPFKASFDRSTGECYGLEFYPNDFDKNIFGETLTFATDSIFVYNEAEGLYKHLNGPAGSEPVIATDGYIKFVNTDLDVLLSCPPEAAWFQIITLPDGYIFLKPGGEREATQYIRVGNDGRLVEKYDESTLEIIVRGKWLCRRTEDAIFVSEL